MSLRVGQIGNGFIGQTLHKVFSQLPEDAVEVFVYDKNPERCLNLKEEAMQADIVFIALPTPMILETGECYTGYIDNAVEEIRSFRKDNLIVLKSTMTPGTTRRLCEVYGGVCYNPEFLTEKRSYEDFIELPYQIIGLGAADQDASPLAKLFTMANKAGITASEMNLFTDSTTAEVVKYTRNCYLAARLSFFNEVKQVCDALNVNYDDMKALVGLDDRVGIHYNAVSREKYPFGGHCLPKDLNAFIYLAKQLGVNPVVVTAVWEKNLEIGDNSNAVRDWEQQEGRAVITLNKKREG